jgi:TRAP-type C4-dicarboxylate transport system permease small subunit
MRADSPAPMLVRIDRGVLALNRFLMIAAMAAMSVIVFASVTIRFATDYSIPWAEEVARYLMVWLTFLGIGPVLRLGGHVAVDTLQDSLPDDLGRVLRLAIVLLMLGFCVLVAWFGHAYVQRTLAQTTAVTEVSFAFVSGAVPVGFVLAIWHLLAICGGYVKERRFETSGDLNPDDAGVV